MLTKVFICPLFDDEPYTFRHVSPLYLLMFRHRERSPPFGGLDVPLHQPSSFLSTRFVIKWPSVQLRLFCFTSKNPPRRRCMRIVRGFGYQIVCARVRLMSASRKHTLVADSRISPAGNGSEVPENSRCFSIWLARAFRNRQRWGNLSHTRSW